MSGEFHAGVCARLGLLLLCLPVLLAASFCGHASALPPDPLFPEPTFGTGRDPNSVAVGDFNADGKLDLAVANQSSNTVSVLLGAGNGTFAVKTDYVTGDEPYSVAIGDFNRDGKPDLAVVNVGSNTVSVLLNIGQGASDVVPVNRSGTVTLLTATPNPARGGTTIRFSIEQRGRARLNIFDPAGRRVRALLDESVDPGPHGVPWDGRDDAGRQLPRGIYFARLQTPARTAAERIVITR